MKLERVNEHQIRCTLTRADLADRQLKLSELAYGTEKAKNLFRDMMRQASYQLGFDAENIPLMIEAVPISSDSILLIITKVEDPDELDTRFANFAPSIREDDQGDSIDELIQSISAGTENVLDLFRKIRENMNIPADAEGTGEALLEQRGNFELTKAYSFDDLDEVAKVAHMLKDFYFGKSSLYRKDGRLLLVINKSNHTPEDFNRVCNMVSEYGRSERFTEASKAYLDEHEEALIKDDALTRLLNI